MTSSTRTDHATPARPSRATSRAAAELDRLAMLTPEGAEQPILSPLPEGECALDGPRTPREARLEHEDRLA